MFKINKKFLAVAILVVAAMLTFFYIINYSVMKKGDGLIYNGIDDFPIFPVALVLGAKVYNDGRMSDMFKDRVDTALLLYKARRIKKILISGDHGGKNYDEVSTAKNYLLDNDVLPEDIFLDHAGFDTYDSIYRARDIFQASELLIVTQNFHLPRAIYIAKNLGLDAYGISADLHQYQGIEKSRLREKFACIKAWLEIALKSNPRFLGEEISILGDGRKSWD